VGAAVGVEQDREAPGAGGAALAVGEEQGAAQLPGAGPQQLGPGDQPGALGHRADGPGRAAGGVHGGGGAVVLQVGPGDADHRMGCSRGGGAGAAGGARGAGPVVAEPSGSRAARVMTTTEWAAVAACWPGPAVRRSGASPGTT